MANYRKPLAETARTDDKDRGDQFNLRYGDKEVDALDGRYASVAKFWKTKRLSCYNDKCFWNIERYLAHNFATADAFVRGVDGRFYFIEFKNQSKENINLEREKLCNKAFESPLAVSFDLLADVPMGEVRKRAIFVVVYREDPVVRGKSQSVMLEQLDRHRTKEVTRGDRVVCMFGLDKFMRGSYPMYVKVYAFTEEEFNDFSVQIFGPQKCH